jgi:hypothetical protein
MDNKCRHIKFSGERCEAYALRGEPFCYFHNHHHAAPKKPPGIMDSIEIPFLEDRCVIQHCITQVVRAVVNNTIDRARASTVLFGLQLALQSTDRKHWAIGFDTATAVSLAPNGDEIAGDPEDEDEYETEEYEDDKDEDNEEEEDGGDGENEEEDGNESTEELIAEGKYSQSVH